MTFTMLSKILFPAFLIVLCVSCRKGMIEEVDINSAGYQEPLWSRSHVSSGNWLDAAPGIFGNWSFNGKALRTVRGENNLILLECIEPKTGEVLWTWSDWFHPETEHTNGRFVLLNDNILHWKSGWRQYWLDLETGETLKKYNGERVFTKFLVQHGDEYFTIGAERDSFPGMKVLSVFKGGLLEENPDLFLLPEVNVEEAISDREYEFVNAFPFFHESDTFLVVGSQKIHENWMFESFIELYDLGREEWVYRKSPLGTIRPDGGIYQPFMFYHGSIVTSTGRYIVCHDILSGKQVWSREFGHDFRFSGFEIFEDILVANCEDENLYGIDPVTGDILWQTGGAGTSSRLRNRVLNGVVYFVGGSTGEIHAVDIRLGATLWRLDAQDYEDSNAYWAVSNVNVVPGQNGEKGHIIVQNATKMFCFEAAR